jgi:ADP-ribose pyrophosphatase
LKQHCTGDLFLSDSIDVFKGKIVTVRVERAIMPDGRERRYEVVRHPGGSAVVALDNEGYVCLLRQWRHAAGGWLLELPAGKLDVTGESPLQTAARELGEEAGLKAAKWKPLGTIVSTPGFSDEILHLFLASDLTETPINREEGEFIEVKWFNLREAVGMAASGEIIDAKTVVGLFRAAANLGVACGEGRY